MDRNEFLVTAIERSMAVGSSGGGGRAVTKLLHTLQDDWGVQPFPVQSSAGWFMRVLRETMLIGRQVDYGSEWARGRPQWEARAKIRCSGFCTLQLTVVSLDLLGICYVVIKFACCDNVCYSLVVPIVLSGLLGCV